MAAEHNHVVGKEASRFCHSVRVRWLFSFIENISC